MRLLPLLLLLTLAACQQGGASGAYMGAGAGLNSRGEASWR